MLYETYTTTESKTFTVTHARHIATKIGTDLKRLQRFYGEPIDGDIIEYEKEVIALLAGDYLDSIEYGFKRNHNNEWCVALKYEARSGGILISDDTPGRIPTGVNVGGCTFKSFLITNHKWSNLSLDRQNQIYADAKVSVTRTSGSEPDGNWKYDKTYSAGGRGVIRSSLY